MPQVILRPTFSKDLDGLKRSARKYYQRATETLIELQRDLKPSAPQRSESRIPDAVKYELPDGYRMVFQKMTDKVLLALVVGTHEHVEAFLDGHKGYLFDAKTGRIRELRLATAIETSVEVAPSAAIESDPVHVRAEADIPPLFADFTDEMLQRIGVAATSLAELRSLRDPNSLECMLALQELSSHAPQAADLLLSFVTGNPDTRTAVIAVASGELELKPSLSEADVESVLASSDEFLTFADPKDLEGILERATFEQWQLFLHPDQKSLVERTFSGPARLRGISGSGKTVVALHRARRLAKQLAGSNRKILFTTFDKGLAASAGRLLDALCGSEREAIEVTHLHRWCLDYMTFCGVPRPKYSPEMSREVRKATLESILSADAELLSNVPRDYVWSEVEFIMGRFLHEDTPKYLDTDRSGRGRALTAPQKKAILNVYTQYHRTLFQRGFVEPAEFVRIALRLRQERKFPEHEYAGVIVDEVQDISELGLRLLHSIAGNGEDGLLLVGDATQRIFTSGFSLRGLGIDIAGRGIILRKNYRNTRQILQAAFPLVQQSWDLDLTTSGVDPMSASPEYSVREGHRPIVVACPDQKAEARFIVSEVTALLRYRHYQARDICILARNKQYRALALNALTKAGIPTYAFQSTPVGESTAEENAVRVSSLHGAKGHEFGAVLIVGFQEGVIPQRTHNDAEFQASEAAVLYVGMTRARDILYLSYSERDASDRRVQPSSFLDQMNRTVDRYEFRH